VPGSVANRLCDYVPQLRNAAEDWRLRLIVHDFGHVWKYSDPAVRPLLIVDEPDPVGDPHWDAFLAAYAEHLAYHARIEAPSWVFDDSRYLTRWWIPVADLESLRVEAFVHAPAAFEAHGVFIARRELEVV